MPETVFLLDQSNHNPFHFYHNNNFIQTGKSFRLGIFLQSRRLINKEFLDQVFGI